MWYNLVAADAVSEKGFVIHSGTLELPLVIVLPIVALRLVVEERRLHTTLCREGGQLVVIVAFRVIAKVRFPTIFL